MGIFSDAAGAVLSGGVTGLLGSGLQVVGQYFTKKQDNAHDEKMRELDMKSMTLEAELKLKQAEQEADAARAIAEQHSFDASFGNDKATYATGPVTGWMQNVLAVVDAVRGVIRPAITMWMCWQLWRIYTELYTLIGGFKGYSPVYIFTLMNDVVYTVLYVATTVILWWFGSRAPAALGNKLASKAG